MVLGDLGELGVHGGLDDLNGEVRSLRVQTERQMAGQSLHRRLLCGDQSNLENDRLVWFLVR